MCFILLETGALHKDSYSTALLSQKKHYYKRLYLAEISNTTIYAQ